jgi:broad specificity phosphatase PhoE
VAACLSRHRVVGIVCSPLRRAHALAQAIADHHDLVPVPDERLTEISHGAWEGLSCEQVQERFPELYRAWQERPHEVAFPDGESLSDVHDRSIAPIAELLAGPRDETWVVVTHDTVARLAVAAAQQRPVVGFSFVSLENGAITTLVGPELVGSVRQLNDVSHLGEHRVDLKGQAL